MTTLTNYERETIILFNDAEPTATVYTCNKSLQNRLDRFCAENASISRVKTVDVSKTYNLPKKWIKVNKPLMYTEETRQKRALQLQAASQERRCSRMMNNRCDNDRKKV